MGLGGLIPLWLSPFCNQRVGGILRFDPQAAIGYGQDLERQCVSRPECHFCMSYVASIRIFRYYLLLLLYLSFKFQ